MSIESIIQTVFNGLLLGGVYGGIAIGLSLILGVLKIVNLAHSAVLIFAAFIYYQLVNVVGLDPLMMIVPVVILGVLFGLLLNKGVAKFLVKEDDSTVLLAFFAVMVILETIAIIIWTTDTRTLRLGYLAGSVQIGAFSFPIARLAAAGITIVLLVAIHFFLTRSYTGKAVRGLSENRDVASMVGIDVPSLSKWVFAAGIGFAAFGGTVLAMVQSFNPQEHVRWLAWAFLVVIIGGLGSVLRTLVAGLLVGVTESLVGLLLPFQYTYLVLYGILAIALLARSDALGQSKERIV